MAFATIFNAIGFICICKASAFISPSQGQSLTTSKFRQYGTILASSSTTTSNVNDGESSSVNPDESMPLTYTSKSTASPDVSCEFHAGSEERKERLHKALIELGLHPDEFLELPEYQGSAALRTYSSFMLPKSEGALAMANQPQRAAVVANNIVFLLKEHRSHQEEWLRNHDRALEEINQTERNPITLVLDNVRSAHNVGNILRAAEASKCTSVLLCGSMTPAPPHPKVLKTALGAAEYVPYEKIGSTLQAIKNLKQNNVKVIGVETTSRSVPLWKSSFFDNNSGKNKEDIHGRHVAFVFGNEMIGVDTQCLEECDELIILPTHGVKNSLNVATCVSVVIWEALRQWDALQEGSN
jgi:23S rRNA (guanosine2251-2'-O)-methyltransferase